MRPPWRPCVCCVYAYYYYCVLMPVGGGAPVSLSDGRGITYRYLKVYRPRRALPSPSRTPHHHWFLPPLTVSGVPSRTYITLCVTLCIYTYIYMCVYPLPPLSGPSSAEPLLLVLRHIILPSYSQSSPSFTASTATDASSPITHLTPSDSGRTPSKIAGNESLHHIHNIHIYTHIHTLTHTLISGSNLFFGVR